jgi:hypothetical protein
MSDDASSPVAVATCDFCRDRGGCIMGIRGFWRFTSTRPDPVTGFCRTKMDELTKPTAGNNYHPPVQAFGGENGARFIVGSSMCAYLRSQQVPRRKTEAKPRRQAKKKVIQPVGPVMPHIPPPPSVSGPTPALIPALPVQPEANNATNPPAPSQS